MSTATFGRPRPPRDGQPNRQPQTVRTPPGTADPKNAPPGAETRLDTGPEKRRCGSRRVPVDTGPARSRTNAASREYRRQPATSPNVIEPQRKAPDAAAMPHGGASNLGGMPEERQRLENGRLPPRNRRRRASRRPARARPQSPGTGVTSKPRNGPLATPPSAPAQPLTPVSLKRRP